jgi:uncharacterized protein YndB with AHSA1/START domain
MKRRWLAGAALGAAAAIGYRQVVRPWHEQWGATPEELDRTLPGDELVAEPAGQVTRGITIDAPPEDVWPWLIQVGADRGGFYSYDWLENLFGLGIYSAEHIVPEWQERAVGDLVFAHSAGSAGWCVAEVRPNEALVLQVADMEAHRPLRRDEQLQWEFLWSFVLRPLPDGRTRLLVRERIGFGSTRTKRLMAPVGLISFVMTRRMLQGIKQRAERPDGG